METDRFKRVNVNDILRSFAMFASITAKMTFEKIRVDPSTCKQRIDKRARPEEEDITLEYLQGNRSIFQIYMTRSPLLLSLLFSIAHSTR